MTIDPPLAATAIFFTVCKGVCFEVETKGDVASQLASMAGKSARKQTSPERIRTNMCGSKRVNPSLKRTTRTTAAVSLFGSILAVFCVFATASHAQDSQSPLPDTDNQPGWLNRSGSRRGDSGSSVSVELGQDVLVDRLNIDRINDDDSVVRQSAPPSMVILQERSSGQQFILNPGQDIALVLPPSLVQGARFEGLRYPLATAAPISSGFGMRVHPITGLSSFHQGIDIAAPTGTPILAAYSGQVIVAGPAGNLGNAVVIAHDEVRRTRYGHMSSIAVQPNTWVEQGTIVGYVGSTGRSTGPHLHFEYWSRESGSWLAMDVSEQLRLLAVAMQTPTASSSTSSGIGGN
ncbi:MAG: M23 family metallopeptidase [Synechococcus sp.]